MPPEKTSSGAGGSWCEAINMRLYKAAPPSHTEQALHPTESPQPFVVRKGLGAIGPAQLITDIEGSMCFAAQEVQLAECPTNAQHTLMVVDSRGSQELVILRNIECGLEHRPHAPVSPDFDKLGTSGITHPSWLPHSASGTSCSITQSRALQSAIVSRRCSKQGCKKIMGAAVA